MIQCFAPVIRESKFEQSPPLRLISASKMDFNYKSTHPRILHKHETFLEVLYVRSGTGVYIIENERYDISKGDIIINNANALHDEDPNMSRDLNMYCITVSDVHIKELPSNCLIPAGCVPVFPAEEHAEIVESTMAMIYVLLATEPDENVETCYHLTMALLSQLIGISRRNIHQDGTKRSRTNQDIISARVKHYIDSHYDEYFTLEDIGEELCISPYYLSHAFKLSTGFSPMHYTTRRRLGEAQSLLTMTDKPIAEIALSIGFGSQNHLHRLFKKYIGMSPGEYRKTYSNHPPNRDPNGMKPKGK